MTGKGWQNCGQGFSGVTKLKGLMKNIHGDRHEKEKVECESPIIAETTPDGKKEKSRRHVRKRQMDANAMKVTHHLRSTSNPVWKPEELLANFDEVDGSLQLEKDEDIDWGSSSSDDSLPNTLCTRSSKETSGTRTDKRKRKCMSSEKDSSKKNSHITAEKCRRSLSNKLSTLNSQPDSTWGSSKVPTVCDCNDKIDNHLDSEINDRTNFSVRKGSVNCKMSPSTAMTNSCEQDKNNSPVKNEKQWAASTFEDLKTTSKTTDRRSCTFKSKNIKENHHLKRRMVRRKLNIGSCDPCGQISDIESDNDLSDVDKPIMSSDDPDITDDENDVSMGLSYNKSSPEKKQRVKASDACSDTEDSQLEIISGTSASSNTQTQEKISATDWIQALEKQKTPIKGEQSAFVQGDDSTKKKKKYTRGSLSDQLCRLVSREKSAIRFWYHSVSAGTFDEKNSKSVTVRLTTLTKQFSVYMSYCQFVDDPGGRVHCKVIFSKETVVKLSLKVGMTVQVFATWQQLETDIDDCTLLCTHFIQVLSLNAHKENEDERRKDQAEKLSASATWNCPCSKDSSIASTKCPAAQCPLIPCIPVQATASCSYKSTSAMLHSISGFSNQPCNVSVKRRTLLESIEDTRSDAPCLPSFCASVLRVFQQKLKNSKEIRFQLLLEDPAGTMAVLMVAGDFVEKLKNVRKLEGKACVFSGLKVVARSNRDKDPMIFTIVDKVWSKRFLNSFSSQSGGDSSQYLQLQKAPNFAYELQPVPNVTCAFSEDNECTNLENTSHSLELNSVQGALQSESGRRVSFVAKVLTSSRLKEAYGLGTVFVFDPSCTRGGNTVVCAVRVQAECVLEDTLSSVCLFKDVLVEEGILCCDAFTLVISHSSWEVWDIQEKITSSVVDRISKCPLNLASFNSDSQPGSLVSVEGYISSVDENSAYSWEECDLCGSDRLATSEEAGAVYCTGCNRKVDSPLVRMKMEVYVQCRSVATNLDVKINLTETTIHSILPAEADEEGYDMDVVIQKFIKCPVCLVQHHFSTPMDRSGKEQTIAMLTELDYTAQ